MEISSSKLRSRSKVCRTCQASPPERGQRVCGNRACRDNMTRYFSLPSKTPWFTTGVWITNNVPSQAKSTKLFLPGSSIAFAQNVCVRIICEACWQILHRGCGSSGHWETPPSSNSKCHGLEVGPCHCVTLVVHTCGRFLRLLTCSSILLGDPFSFLTWTALSVQVIFCAAT